MKQTKRIISLLICVVMFALTPISVLAASWEYVPTKATTYSFDGEKWAPQYEVTYSYKKDGRITKYVFKSLLYNSNYTSTHEYKWKGNYLSKRKDGNTIYTYKYNKKKLKSIVTGYTHSSEKETRTYKWKKNSASYKETYGTTGTITINSKGQIIKEKLNHNKGGTYFITYQYYKNGNLKKYTYKRSDGSTVRITKYDKRGYPTSGKFNGNTTYKYKKKNEKITEQLITTKTTDGYINKEKTVYSKWKKVSRVRNCDAFGTYIITPYVDP